jgi:hypothetical protein
MQVAGSIVAPVAGFQPHSGVVTVVFKIMRRRLNALSSSSSAAGSKGHIADRSGGFHLANFTRLNA